jgi:hypothetical protein
MLLLSNPEFKAQSLISPVKTKQVAPTVLRALGLNPNALDGVKIEGTRVLPGIRFQH